MKKILALAGLLFILTSCSTVSERMGRVSLGMNKQQVLHAVGKPTSTGGGASGVEVLHYTQDDGWWRMSYYFVRLVDGKVESYGPETRANLVTDSNPPLKK